MTALIGFTCPQWVVLGVSLLMTVSLAWGCIRLWLSRSWPTVKGRIIVSEVKRQWDREGGRPSFMYSPHVVYRYEVKGRAYTGKQVSAGEVASSIPCGVGDPSLRFPVGSEVTVIYNPWFPRDSLLPSARPKGFWYLLTFVVPATGIYLVWSGIIR